MACTLMPPPRLTLHLVIFIISVMLVGGIPDFCGFMAELLGLSNRNVRNIAELGTPRPFLSTPSISLIESKHNHGVLVVKLPCGLSSETYSILVSPVSVTSTASQCDGCPQRRALKLYSTFVGFVDAINFAFHCSKPPC